MLPGFPGDQITPDQAPPLALPLSFFFVGMLYLLSSGPYIIIYYDTVLVSNWMPVTLGFTHFGTLGFLGSIMMGAFYQMTPVVAGKPVPFIKAGYATLFFHTAGTALFITGLISLSQPILKAGLIIEGIALVIFLVPTLTAVFTAPTKHPSVTGMRLALLSLLLTLVLGTVLGLAHLGIQIPGLRTSWFQTHITIAVFGWIGTLIIAVSWQVIPMFYMTPYYNAKGMRTTIRIQIFLLVLLLGSLVFSITTQWKLGLDLASWGYMVLVWFAHPVITLSHIAKRRRKNKDGSLLFWKLGLLTALTCLPVSVLVFYNSRTSFPLLLGWLAIWGWAGSIVHGMLYRIIPFLIWFHKFSHLVGLQMVPSMKSLLPEKQITLAFVLHLLTLFLGTAAILTTHTILIISTAISLSLTGFILLDNAVMALLTARRAGSNF